MPGEGGNEAALSRPTLALAFKPIAQPASKHRQGTRMQVDEKQPKTCAARSLSCRLTGLSDELRIHIQKRGLVL
jgi:hypothetical protein